MVRIAVVGDESAIRHATIQRLASRGWDVALCSAGQDAMDFIEKEKPDILLLIMRPEDSEQEWTLLRRLEDGVQTYDLPMIVCAPNRDEFDALQRFLQQRGIEVWYPPYEIGVLEDLIQTAQLKAERKRRERQQRRTPDVERGRGA